jgi:hypothetical protein
MSRYDHQTNKYYLLQIDKSKQEALEGSPSAIPPNNNQQNNNSKKKNQEDSLDLKPYKNATINSKNIANDPIILNDENNPDITEFLTTFLNSVPVRPTQEQIDNSSRLIVFDSIQAPNSTTCAISLEPFASGDTVRQLHHCGHIFFPDQFNQWFRNNVRCPVCRHDIRSFTPVDISNNELSDNLLSTIASRFLTSLLNPTANVSNNSTSTSTSTSNNNEDRIMYDPETAETILRSNNNQG